MLRFEGNGGKLTLLLHVTCHLAEQPSQCSRGWFTHGCCMVSTVIAGSCTFQMPEGSFGCGECTPFVLIADLGCGELAGL